MVGYDVGGRVGDVDTGVDLAQQDDRDLQLEGASQLAVVAIIAARAIGIVEEPAADLPVRIGPVRVADDAEGGLHVLGVTNTPIAIDRQHALTARQRELKIRAGNGTAPLGRAIKHGLDDHIPQIVARLGHTPLYHPGRGRESTVGLSPHSSPRIEAIRTWAPAGMGAVALITTCWLANPSRNYPSATRQGIAQGPRPRRPARRPAQPVEGAEPANPRTGRPHPARPHSRGRSGLGPRQRASRPPVRTGGSREIEAIRRTNRRRPRPPGTPRWPDAPTRSAPPRAATVPH